MLLLFQMGYPVLILGDDCSIVQKRFLTGGVIDIEEGKVCVTATLCNCHSLCNCHHS